MLWFNTEKKKKMEFIQNYVPTSKAQLIQVAMMYNKGDLHKAQEMFDFYAKNLDLPDFDPIAPSFMQQVKREASELFAFIRDNKDDLAQGYELIRSAIVNRGALPVGEAAGAATEALPPINE